MIDRLSLALLCSCLAGVLVDAQAVGESPGEWGPSDRPGWAFDEGAGARWRPTASWSTPPGSPAKTRRGSSVMLVPEKGAYQFGVSSTENGTRFVYRTPDAKLEGTIRPSGAGITWGGIFEAERGDELILEMVADGAREVQLWWRAEWNETGGFPAELLSSRDVRVLRPDTRLLDAFERLHEDGVELMERSGCHHCHSSLVEAVGGDQRTAPSLAGVGARLGASWIERWLKDPRAIRSDAHMPRLEIVQYDDNRRDLVQFLMSQGTGVQTDVADENQVIAKGRDLFHQVGCVACHGARVSPAELYDDPTLSDEIPDISPVRAFGDLAGKWQAPALADFLRDPSKTHGSGRMPSLRLTASEADLIATYLVDDFGAPERFAIDEAAAARGQAIFIKAGCVECHPNDELAQGHRMPDVPIERPWEGTSCLGKLSTATPDFGFTPSELADARLALHWACDESVAHDRPEPVPDTLKRMSCTACHVYEGEGGVPEVLDLYFQPKDERVDIGDEGRLPPDLEQVGVKYTTDWLREVLLEKGVARPYMHVRMPAFHEDVVAPLVEGFAYFDGVAPTSDAEPPAGDDELVLAGRELMARGKFGCIACHNFLDRTPDGSPGVGLDTMTHRLRWEWALPYLANPQRYRPGGRMPNFGTGKSSSVVDVLDGDLERQLEAMWTYLSLGGDMPPPAGMGASNSLQLQPAAKPIVLRGFVRGAGSRAIAVGLPVGVHFAYDAEEARLAFAWRGEFLDASGAWAGRGGNVYGGLGDRIWTAISGRVLAGDDFEFLGYSLDEAGHPTFHSKVGGVELDESLEVEVTPELVLRRTFVLRPPPGGGTHWLRTGSGVTKVVAENCQAVHATREGAEGVEVNFELNKRQARIVVEVKP